MANSRNLPPADIEARVLEVLRRHVDAGDTLCVGLSGGMDSVALLRVLKNLSVSHGYQLSAVHVNHGLLAEALSWESFCSRLCQEWDIPLLVERVVVDPMAPDGLEAAARKARYEVFSRQKVRFVVLAHHKDDQAETLLIQLLRGAGLPGLVAMPERRSLGEGCPDLLRPLLQTARDELQALCSSQGEAWVEDPSNEDLTLRRNYLRKEVLPRVQVWFPAWRDTLGRSAGHLGEAMALLDEMAREDLARCQDSGGLLADRVLSLGKARAANMLRWWLRSRGVPACPQARLDEWVRQSTAPADRAPAMVWAGWAMRRYRNWWCLVPDVQQGWNAVELAHWPEGNISLDPGVWLVQKNAIGRGIRKDILNQGPFTVRCRSGGEKLRPKVNGPTRSLKNLFQEAGWPGWEREACPLLFQGNRLLQVPGLAVEAAVQAGPGEPGVLLEWHRPIEGSMLLTGLS